MSITSVMRAICRLLIARLPMRAKRLVGLAFAAQGGDQLACLHLDNLAKREAFAGITFVTFQSLVDPISHNPATLLVKSSCFGHHQLHSARENRHDRAVDRYRTELFH